MLAMLSLVFKERCPIRSKGIFATTSDGGTGTNILPVTQAPNQGQEISRSYFQREGIARSLLEPLKTNSHPPIETRKAAGIPNSATSSVGASNSDPLTPFSTDGTPPSMSRPIRPHLGRKDLQTTGTSTSPEHHRHNHRSSSNLASALAASISRPFSFTASASSSPPTTYPKKRMSPAGSFLGAPTPGVTWGTTSYFGKSSTIREDPKSYSVLHSDADDSVSVSKTPAFRTRLRNQDQFHNDGYADVPLLDPDQEPLYHGYRQAYAHLLHIWEMPFARCRVLKFGNSAPLSPSLPSHGPASAPLDIGRTNTVSSVSELKNSGLDFRNHCTTCSAILLDHSSPHSCPICTRPQPPLLCLLCVSIIRGLSSPCLSCGHVLHSTCRALLLPHSSIDSISIDSMSCISGCGCDCASHAIVEVEYPSRRKSSASLTVTGEEAGQQDPFMCREATPDDEEAWEDIAYESLARNLGAKYLTPRPSQIWRGG
jgi:WD repeat-containing protein 59